MTIVGFAQDDENYYLASDTRIVNYGSFVSNMNKIYKINSYHVGFSGYIALIKAFLARRSELPLLIQDDNDVKKLLETVDSSIVEINLKTVEDCDINCFPLQMFVGSSHGIWEIDEAIQLFKVSDYYKFSFIGSGFQYATASLHTSLRYGKDIKTSLRMAINVAKTFDTTCGGKTRFVTISKKSS